MAKRGVTIKMSELPPRLHRPRDEHFEQIFGGMMMGCAARHQSCANGESCCVGYVCVQRYMGFVCDLP